MIDLLMFTFWTSLFLQHPRHFKPQIWSYFRNALGPWALGMMHVTCFGGVCSISDTLNDLFCMYWGMCGTLEVSLHVLMCLCLIGNLPTLVSSEGFSFKFASICSTFEVKFGVQSLCICGDSQNQFTKAK